jgi:hypothetical protein
MVIPASTVIQPIINSTPEALTLSTTVMTPEQTPTPVPVKTTYSPIPAWIALAGLGLAAAFAVWLKK